jgi:hypothetical protein
MGLVFLGIVGLETVAARLVAGIAWRDAFLLCLAANLVSSLIGILLSHSVGTSVLLLSCLVLFLFRREFGSRSKRYLRLASICFVVVLVSHLLLYIVAVENLSVGVFASLIPAFAITVLIEESFWRRAIEHRKALVGTLTANGLSYGFLVAIILLAGIRAEETPLASHDFFAIQATTAAEHGAQDQALTRLSKAREVATTPSIGFWFQREEQSADERGSLYFPWAEKRVAEAFMDAGRYELAESVLSEVLSYSDLIDETSGELRQMLSICESKIAERK